MTPDMVIQRDAKFGVVGELKVSLPKDKSVWKTVVEQALDYTEPLVGWWTADEKIEGRDVVLLLQIARSRDFSQYLDSQPEEVRSRFASVTLVEFTRSDQGSPYIFYRSEKNSPSDSSLAAKLGSGIQVPISKVLETFPTLEFYDATPPLLYTLRILWQNVVASQLSKYDFDAELKATPIPVSVSNIVEELQKASGSGAIYSDERSKQFPKETWIRQALEFLVSRKLALPDPEGGGNYTVLFKRFREDVEAKFASMILAGSSSQTPASEAGQMPLFGSQPSSTQ